MRMRRGPHSLNMSSALIILVMAAHCVADRPMQRQGVAPALQPGMTKQVNATKVVADLQRQQLGQSNTSDEHEHGQQNIHLNSGHEHLSSDRFTPARMKAHVDRAGKVVDETKATKGYVDQLHQLRQKLNEKMQQPHLHQEDSPLQTAGLGQRREPISESLISLGSAASMDQRQSAHQSSNKTIKINGNFNAVHASGPHEEDHPPQVAALHVRMHGSGSQDLFPVPLPIKEAALEIGRRFANSSSDSLAPQDLSGRGAGESRQAFPTHLNKSSAGGGKISGASSMAELSKIAGRGHGKRRGAPTQKNRLVIRGATGINAAAVNGEYFDSGHVYNGRVLYQKAADSDRWLRFVTAGHLDQWRVSSSQSVKANDDKGYIYSKESGLANPTEAKEWYAWMGTEWRLQPSIGASKVGTWKVSPSAEHLAHGNVEARVAMSISGLMLELVAWLLVHFLALALLFGAFFWVWYSRKHGKSPVPRWLSSKLSPNMSIQSWSNQLLSHFADKANIKQAAAASASAAPTATAAASAAAAVQSIEGKAPESTG